MKFLALHKSFIILFFTLIIGIVLERTIFKTILGPDMARIIFTILVIVGFLASFYFHNKEMEIIKNNRLKGMEEENHHEKHAFEDLANTDKEDDTSTNY